jgi:hypothetical protein
MGEKWVGVVGTRGTKTLCCWPVEQLFRCLIHKTHSASLSAFEEEEMDVQRKNAKKFQLKFPAN